MKIVYKFLYKIASKMPASDSKFNFGAKKMRAYFAKKFINKNSSSNINIDKNVLIDETLTIGYNSGIGINSRVGKNVTLGENVMIGPECLIYTENHNFKRTDIPMCKQGVSEVKPVSIGDDVWIGARVIILPGVTIGNGCIIGAGSVVTKDIPEYVVAAGNPAIVKKRRMENI